MIDASQFLINEYKKSGSKLSSRRGSPRAISRNENSPCQRCLHPFEPIMIKPRLIIAKKEIKASKDYDYKVINKEGKVEETVVKIEEYLKNQIAAI